ncbi:MAG: hypothetical protein QNJ55_31450 [Xenococcus sp. MO_188.B8]|nr:hypothetical protein [Xenococcus sp. MO_188.B8]
MLAVNNNWEVLNVTKDKVNQEHLIQLESEKIGGLIIRDFYPRKACIEMSQYLLTEPFDSKKPADNVEIFFLGVNMTDISDDKEEYFRLAEKSWKDRKELIKRLNVPDPVQQAIKLFSKIWSAEVKIPEEDGRLLFCGNFRRINGIDIHMDWAPFLFPQWNSLSSISEQYALNIFFQAPEVGGELVVYKQTWTEDDEIFRYKERNLVGFNRAVLRGKTDCAVIKGQEGWAVLTKTRHYHEVWPQEEAEIIGHRFVCSNFVGKTQDNSLIFWS